MCRPVTEILASFSSLWAAEDYTHAHKRIVNIMKMYIERNNKHVELIRFREQWRLYFHWKLLSGNTVSGLPCWKLVSLLSGTSRHYSMCWVRPMFRVMTTSVPAISGHNQFGTYSLRDIPNSEHTHFGTCHIGTSIIRECGKSVQATIRLYFVTIHAVYNCLGRIATASERTASIIATS